MIIHQVDRTEGGATGAGGVPFPLAPGVSAAPAVRAKHLGRIKGDAAGAGSVLLSLA
ncbi:hypothetical protein [Sansalvadorimonas verongulae]|uniref:hypothetical protein n=1 Tax=Sansalvadorimonas verongulae TaxID=2172824 RepID=UPI0012BBDF82|nr:hypothetical protein [Sansalvadorimonas verongulae]